MIGAAPNGESKMLFLIYWELNEEIDAMSRLQAAEKLAAAELFPPKNVDVIRFDSTPDLWGMTLVEASNVEDVSNVVNMWRIACPGIFKKTKISPARPVQESMASIAELIKKLAADKHT
ncbi:hypothetical protein KT99_21339 [Shewanella benthica KT99]|uniref:DUF3303 domain-containing protein n=2 Tax=Shewanella benthica TaxID=43661 RepID=A9DBR8_9GAMM|nr:hypothetical protein KT99_21339 [Shewanella benthica KT99]